MRYEVRGTRSEVIRIGSRTSYLVPRTSCFAAGLAEHGGGEVYADGTVASAEQVELQVAGAEAEFEDGRAGVGGEFGQDEALPAPPLAGEEGGADPIIGPGELVVEEAEGEAEEAAPPAEGRIMN